MIDTTGKKLLRLLQPDHPVDLRCAAIRVLAELGTRDAEVTRALCELLSDREPSVRVQVMKTIGRLRIEQALPQLLAHAGEGGPEAEVAAQAAAHLGAKGAKALQDLMGQVAPGLRRRIAGALAAGGTSSAGAAAIDALLDNDPGVVDAAVRSLLGEVPALSEVQRRGLADHVLELVDPKRKAGLPAASETALIRLLAALGDPRGEAAFWARVDPANPPELRSAALQALGTLPLPQKKDRLQLLFLAAADGDFRVAAPALMQLRALPVTDRAVPDWLTLLQAPDVAARRFAMDKLGDRDSPAIAAAQLRQLGHPDRGLREEALSRLARSKHGRQALAQALLDAQNNEEAWSLARVQAPFARDYPADLRNQLFAQACKFLEVNDRRSDALLFLLREADARALRDHLEERALAARKKKQYATALTYLRLLARDPACADTIRLELAACGLKAGERGLSAEARNSHPSLQQFARLVHNHETDPVEWLKKARWLDPEDLLYLGFHFAEGGKPEREFGAAVLRLVIQRSPRSKLAKDAKSKLRSAGLE
jgi:HEAT repeat protein